MVPVYVALLLLFMDVCFFVLSDTLGSTLLSFLYIGWGHTIKYGKGVVSGNDLSHCGAKTLTCLRRSLQLSFSLSCRSRRHRMKAAWLLSYHREDRALELYQDPPWTLCKKWTFITFTTICGTYSFLQHHLVYSYYSLKHLTLLVKL